MHLCSTFHIGVRAFRRHRPLNGPVRHLQDTAMAESLNAEHTVCVLLIVAAINACSVYVYGGLQLTSI